MSNGDWIIFYQIPVVVPCVSDAIQSQIGKCVSCGKVCGKVSLEELGFNDYIIQVLVMQNTDLLNAFNGLTKVKLSTTYSE